MEKEEWIRNYKKKSLWTLVNGVKIMLDEMWIKLSRKKERHTWILKIAKKSLE